MTPSAITCGATENVHLDVYFIGFPSELQDDLSSGITKTLRALNIVDAQPWWTPNVPKYGAPGFATELAPGTLPASDTPPDGLLRFLPNVVQKQVTAKGVNWIPLKEITDLVEDWHQNADIVNYVEHAGSYRGVPWQIQGLQVHFLRPSGLTDVSAAAYEIATLIQIHNPPAQIALYSYNVLMDWLARFNQPADGQGGATLVFLNLPGLGQPYAFYAEPAKDAVPAMGIADTKYSMPPRPARRRPIRRLLPSMTAVLDGGLTQPKMLAAMDVNVCRATRWPLPVEVRSPECSRAAAVQQWSLSLSRISPEIPAGAFSFPTPRRI